MKNPSLWPKIQAILEDVLAFPENARADALAAHSHEAPEILEEVQAFLAHETEGNALFDTAFLPTSAQDVPDQESLLPQHIGPYAILGELGQGGMGIVYLAQRADENYVSRVAIKVLKRGMDTLEILRRFRNERQILASLNHPNIARLFDGGTTPSGNPYFVMEMVEGKPIDEFAKNLLLRGKILAAKGSPSFSYNCFEEALAIAKVHWGESHFELAPYYSRMASAYFGRGPFQKALELSQRALDLYENANPVDHDVLADLLQCHGELLSVTKQYPKAERFLLESVNIREQFTKTSSSQGMAHFSLGMLYFYWRRDEEAVFHYHRALELQEAVVGKDHFSLAEILQQIGALYSVKSEFAKAHSYYDRAVKLLEKNAPSNLPKLANFHMLISANYLLRGFDIQAEASAEQSLAMMEELEWFMSPNLAAPLILLAQIAIKMNAYDVADQHLNRAYEILDRSTGFMNDFGFHVLQTSPTFAILGMN